MKIIPIIESQILNIIKLGYEPCAIQIHEELFDTFIEECKSFLPKEQKIEDGKPPKIKVEVMRFMGLPISNVNYSRVQFEHSKGFVAPIQVTIKTYHLGEQWKIEKIK